MTFTINNTDFSSYLTAYGYSTSYSPVFSNSMVDMSGVEHIAILRYKRTLSVTLKPLTGSEWLTLSAILATGILSVTFFCIQQNADVACQMRLDDMSAEMVLKNASRTLYGNTQLNFVEL